MQQPLALVLYEKLMPGSQLVNRLQDLNYRVITISQVDQMVEKARTEGLMLILGDLACTTGDVIKAISELKRDKATAHIPIVAFAEEKAADLREQAQRAGAKLVVTESAIVAHLSQFLEQALRLE